MEKKLKQIDVGLSTDSDYNIDELIAILQEWKIKGATNVSVSGSRDCGQEIEGYFLREETDEESKKRERNNWKITWGYDNQIINIL